MMIAAFFFGVFVGLALAIGVAWRWMGEEQ